MPLKKYLAIITILGFFLDLVAFWPGFMYVDTIDQYGEVMTGVYGDWHPPVMAGFWSVLNKLHKGPQIMLVFQLLLLWLSYYLIADTWCRRSLSLLCLTGLFAAAPYVQNFAGLIVKDAQMALCWLLAAAILLRSMHQQRKMNAGEAITVFILLTYGTMVRINALPGSVLLYFAWVDNLFPGRLLKKLSLLAATLASVLLIQAALHHFILTPRKQYPEYKLLTHDIAGIYVATGQSCFPPFISNHPGFDTSYIRTHFTTATFDNIWGRNVPNPLFPPLGEATREELIKAWKKSILKHPFTYLRNRFDGFLYFLHIKNRKDAGYFYCYPFIHPNPFGFALTDNRLRNIYISYMSVNIDMPYMKGWCWLVLPVLLLILTLRMPTGVYKKAGMALSCSSLLYLLPQFFIYPADTEFRYLYWCCIATAFHAVLWLTRGIETARYKTFAEQQPSSAPHR